MMIKILCKVGNIFKQQLSHIKLNKMNNRKQTNKRGKNPRSITIQKIVEPSTIFRKVDGELVEIPNPRFGTKNSIAHLNFKQALPL